MTRLQEESRSDQPAFLIGIGIRFVARAIVARDFTKPGATPKPIRQFGIVVTVLVNHGPAGPTGGTVLEVFIEGQASHLSVVARRRVHTDVRDSVSISGGVKHGAIFPHLTCTRDSAHIVNAVGVGKHRSVIIACGVKLTTVFPHLVVRAFLACHIDVTSFVNKDLDAITTIRI